ncbi:uncharacterized protein SPSK_07563 [Sporothrix schenckii 1099-18]|uniref:Chitin-binding type-4 domain-containing protein n=2 Tax=Sporothrix schenckii TaxID=29908 RepID=U7Q4N7_SPOS1|nr:uncharacterized protein SPSK_07563 [Sporothrix schenckii 1099-18]ERT01676.1 hypothetical protein HMPREF1624_02928 [Sporothrix schenckii ATCC 58251]KJR88907.1 hypothetical protein SPSK_07563 [Sporothrix schenckii 1099-18]
MFAHVLTVALVALLSASPVLAHMTMASPVPFGNPTTSPLNSDGSNYPCQIVGSASTFYADSASSANNTMALGATQTLSFHGSAVHGGGSCQLALTKDLQPSASTSWQVILSIEGGCPTTDGSGPSTYDYTIPDSIAPGKYVFAWTWISKLSGAPEYYMNCAPVTITGKAAKRDAIEARDGSASSSSSSSSALPNLFVANLASINSCKTTTSTDPVYPDPGPNLLKPSKMTTNFQPPSGTDCFPLGASSNSSSGSGSGTGSGSGSGSGSSSVGAGSASSAGPVVASSSKATSVAAPATTLTTRTKSASSSATGTANGTATATGGVFVTVSTGAPGATGASKTASGTTPSTTPASAVSPASAAPKASGSASSSGSGGGLSGACTTEGMFNCIGGTRFQQCASGTWTALQAMPAGTKCQDGQSTTLWARSEINSAKRLRRARRL